MPHVITKSPIAENVIHCRRKHVDTPWLDKENDKILRWTVPSQQLWIYLYSVIPLRANRVHALQQKSGEFTLSINLTQFDYFLRVLDQVFFEAFNSLLQQALPKKYAILVSFLQISHKIQSWMILYDLESILILLF